MKQLVAAVPLFLALLGCTGRASGGPSPTPAEPVEPMTSEQARAPSSSECPSQDFPRFLKAFSNDAGVQRAFTAQPYIAVIENDEGQHASSLSPDQIEFPVMLGDAQLVEHWAKMETVRKAPDWYQVSTYSEGSGAYSMTFIFRLRNGCWQLTDSIDAST